MKSSHQKHYTVDNNLNATNNVLAAVVESGQDINIAYLGTIGMYGYGTAGMNIPEDYLWVKVETDDSAHLENEILYPTNPDSIFHMTKTLDQRLFFSTTRTTRSGSLTSTRASSGMPRPPRPGATSTSSAASTTMVITAPCSIGCSGRLRWTAHRPREAAAVRHALSSTFRTPCVASRLPWKTRLGPAAGHRSSTR